MNNTTIDIDWRYNDTAGGTENWCWKLDSGLIYFFFFSLQGMLLISLTFYCMVWWSHHPWRTFKAYVFLNILLSMNMINVTQFIQNYAYIPNNYVYIVIFITRMFEILFAIWFFVVCFFLRNRVVYNDSYLLNYKWWKTNIMAWGLALLYSTYSHLAVGYSPYLFAVITFPIYAIYIFNVYTHIHWLIRPRLHTDKGLIVKTLTYTTVAFLILVTIQIGECAPEWSCYTWLSWLAMLMFVIIFFVATGDFCYPQTLVPKLRFISSVGLDKIKLQV